MTRYLKQVEISISEAHDLGFCPINQTSEFPFTILNPNLKPLSYSFKFTQFTISPSKGVLMPNSLSNFKIQFKPSNASVLVGTVILQIQGHQTRIFRFSAVGKYPYISIKQQELNFDDILVTNTISRQIVLKNSSQVSAKFKITHKEDDFPDNFYHLHPNQGVIPPKMNYSLKVFYNPKFVNSEDNSEFKMVCQSGNQIALNFKGRSKNFDIKFSSNSINFGEIKLDNYSSKVLSITNQSEIQTQFEFFTDSGNIFGFSEIKGILQKQSTKKIIIDFRPRNTIAYYERVYCLIRNHSLFYVDLLGTCYDLLIKPIPLLQNHIDVFRKRVIQGRISEIQLKYIENNALLKMAKRIQGGEQYGLASQQNFYQTSNIVSEHPYMLHKQLFMQNKNNELIAISDDFIEFGFCQLMTLSGQREIQVVNKMQCKLSLYWVNQKRQTLNGQYMTVFQVYPQSATLKPNVPVKFQINFRPLKSGAFYFQNMQYFAIKHNQKVTKKTLQQFQKKDIKSKPQTTLLRNVKINQTIQTRVKEQLQTTQVFPTLSGIIKLSGHSFSHSTMPYLPILKLIPSKGVVFKPCKMGTSVYDTIKLINPSDTPIYFKIQKQQTRAFRFYPKIGLIEPKSFCVVGIQFTPSEYKLYKSVLNIILNDMPGSSNVKLPLLGTCTEPQLELQDNGKIFFSPNSVGVYSKKQYKIKNNSKTNTVYRIKVDQKYENLIYFDPSQKQLGPNQVYTVNSYFCPPAKKKYKFKVLVQAQQTSPDIDLNIGYYKPGSGSLKHINQTQKPKPKTKYSQIQIVGQGSDGSIQISEQQINFGAVKINESKKISVKVLNNSQCAFYVDLAIKPFKSTNNLQESQINGAFKLNFKNGIIPANSQIEVGITFNPIQILNFDLKLIVNARQRAPKKIPIKSKGIQPVIKSEMRIIAQGNYPQLQIIDIRNETLSVAALWQNFQISQINHALTTNLSPQQRLFLGIQNLTFTESKKLQNRLKNYEWNLGYVSAKSKQKPRKVIITVKNFGGTVLDYVFKFPSDNKIQEELWADPGQPSEQEAYQKAILDNNIFQIKPKIGNLKPGEVKDIQLIYSPAALDFSKITGSSSQVHMLRVVFQILNGKSLVFNLKGTTLGPNEGLLTVKKNHFELPKVPIGLMTPLRFPIEINNVGSIKITYKTHVQYEEEQFQEVFKIQNPSNFLISGENSYLYCLYKPLMNKNYAFKVFIEVYDFSKMIQTVQLNFKSIDSDRSFQIESKKREQMIPRQRTSVSQVGSKAFFSIQDIDFGRMLSNKTKYKMIILYNMSKSNSLTYQFPSQANIQKMGLTCGDKFVIEPSTGTLEPDSFFELKLTLTTIEHPANYEGQIACNITWSQSGYSNEDNEATQKQISLTAQRETLFLRINKQSELEGKKMTKQNKIIQNQKKSLIETVFGNIISNVLNENSLIEEIKNLDQQNYPLIDLVDEKEPVWPGSQNKIAQPTNLRDYGHYQQLFLNDQFKQVAELIMENTFFNIIQQTTHKQNDFLRISKKFVQSNNQN